LFLDTISGLIWNLFCVGFNGPARCDFEQVFEAVLEILSGRRPPEGSIAARDYAMDMRGGIAWRLLPNGFPPWLATCRWSAQCRDDGTW